MTSFQQHISEDLVFKETLIKSTDILCEPKDMVTNMVPFFTWGENMEALRKREMFDFLLLVSSLLPESRAIHA